MVDPIQARKDFLRKNDRSRKKKKARKFPFCVWYVIIWGDPFIYFTGAPPSRTFYWANKRKGIVAVAENAHHIVQNKLPRENPPPRRRGVFVRKKLLPTNPITREKISGRALFHNLFKQARIFLHNFRPHADTLVTEGKENFLLSVPGNHVWGGRMLHLRFRKIFY